MSIQQLKDVIRLASEISEKSVSPEGFVSIHRLLESFQAEIEFRPLLVEGVIARPKEAGNKWRIFIDSETHSCTAHALAVENPRNALSTRLRNTVAHELAHTLAFRSEEFKIASKGGREEIVQQLEKETENLSPVLLLPYTEVQKLCDARLNIKKLVSFRKAHAVSNEVLIQRFEMLRRIDNHPLQFSPVLTNIAIGTGEWKNSGTPILAHGPIFSVFSESIPSLLTQIKNKQTPSIAENFNDPGFVVNGGAAYTSSAFIDAGTSHNPSGDRMNIEIQIEETETPANAKFLWLLQAARV